MVVNHQSSDHFNVRYMGDRSYSYTCSLLYFTLRCVVPPQHLVNLVLSAFPLKNGSSGKREKKEKKERGKVRETIARLNSL